MTLSLSDLSAKELARIDAICLDFEQRLRRGERVDIEPLVRTYGGSQAALLRAELQGVATEIAAESSGRRMTSAAPERGPHASGPNSHARWPRPGDMLGPYRIQRMIGRGGMGEVYLGCDERLGRDVAIKILVEDWADHPNRLERFARETRAVATLSHPNIVSLYDVGDHQGRPYAVMELLVGETLRDQLRNAPPMAAPEVRRIGAAAADALAAAHAAGIIHRDLKPENLFLTRGGIVKLLDFGLSRSHSDTGGASDPTATGIILGTVGYLSPEQANGGRVTPAADLFGLGCVLHECFYGVRPFAGQTVAESLAAIINGQPAVDADLAARDAELARIIARCLEKDPVDRFASADAVAAALRPATDTATGSISRRGLFRRLGVASLVLGGAGVAGLAHWSRLPSAIRSVAVLPLEDGVSASERVDGMATRELGDGEQLAAAIADQLTRIDDLRVVPFLPLRKNGLQPPAAADSGADAEGAQVSPESLKLAAEHLGVDAILVGSVSSDADGYQTIDVRLIHGGTGYQIGTYRTRVKEQTNLIDQQKTASKVAEGIGRELAVYHSGATRENGSYHCLLNGYSRMDTESIGALTDALRCFQNAIRQDEKFAEAYAGLALTAMILASQSDFKERTDLVTMARRAAASALELESDLGGALLATAMIQWQVDWRFHSAALTFDSCVYRMRDNWVAQHEYALFLAARGEFTAALKHAERAVSLDLTSAAFRLDEARIRWFGGAARSLPHEIQTAVDEVQAVAQVATGTAADSATGTLLDLLEHRGDLALAGRILATAGFPGPAAEYWARRQKSLKKLPYGPYDAGLNKLIFDLRRGESPSDEEFLQLKNNRSPRLPLLLSAHPALTPLRDRSPMRDLVADSRYTS